MAGKVKAIPAGYEGATNILGSSFRSWQHRAQGANRLLDRDAVSGAFGFVKLGNCCPVSDIEGAIAFYRDTLGMRFLQ